MPHRTTFDAAIAANASKFAVGGSAVGATASVFSVDWVTWVGVTTGLIAFVVQMFFSARQWQRSRQDDKRQAREEVRRDREEARREKEHVAYLQALKEGHVTPPKRGADER